MLDEPTLTRMYLDLIAQTRSRLDLLVAGALPRDVSELAHSMHGATAMLGAISLAEAAALLEQQPQPLAVVPKIVEAMRLDCLALETALREQQVKV